MDIREEKALLRTRIVERMEHLSPKERAAESRSICRRILEHLSADIRTVCAYVPLPSEADIRPLLRTFLRRKIALFLPRFAGNRLTFHEVTDLDHLVLGALNIREPSPDSPALDPRNLDLVLIPGRAFDREGHRLGRGNGGYDVWIRAQRAANPTTRFWGVSLECQIARDVPSEAHDETVDSVITARGPLGPARPERSSVV